VGHLDAARQIMDFSAGLTAEQLQADKRTGYAIERALEIVGEAARRVNQDTRCMHPEIPWSGINGFRNVLASIRRDRLPAALRGGRGRCSGADLLAGGRTGLDGGQCMNTAPLVQTF